MTEQLNLQNSITEKQESQQSQTSDYTPEYFQSAAELAREVKAYADKQEPAKRLFLLKAINSYLAEVNSHIPAEE